MDRSGTLDEEKGQENSEMSLQYSDDNSYALLRVCILFATRCSKYFIWIIFLQITSLGERNYYYHTILQMERLRLREINLFKVTQLSGLRDRI